MISCIRGSVYLEQIKNDVKYFPFNISLLQNYAYFSNRGSYSVLFSVYG